MISRVSFTTLFAVTLDASININTLPPDFRRMDLSERIPPRSTINPAWTGDHSAALDGEQNKVVVSWSMIGDQVEFQVRHNIFSIFYILCIVKTNDLFHRRGSYIHVCPIHQPASN